MLPLAAGRRAVIRDLDATIAILRGLTAADRERNTPCEGWDVRHLSAHMAQQTRKIAADLVVHLQHPPEETEPKKPEPGVNPTTPWNEIIARLTTGRNQLATVLAHLDDDDLDRAPEEAETCRHIFNVTVLEFGLHRSDMEAALGKPGGVNIETVLAADFLYGTRLPAIAAATLPQGPGSDPFAIRLRGDDIINYHLVWDGASWSMAPGAAPVTLVRGIDSAVVLFMMGRIPLADRRLHIAGDREVVGRFKTFIPGP